MDASEFSKSQSRILDVRGGFWGLHDIWIIKAAWMSPTGSLEQTFRLRIPLQKAESFLDRPFQQLCFVPFLKQSIFFHQMTTYLQRFFFGGQPVSGPNQSGTHHRSRSDHTNYIYGPPARSASSVAPFSATSSRSNSPSATPMTPSPLRHSYDNAAAVQARSFGFQRQHGPERSVIRHRETYRPMGSGTPRYFIYFFVRTLNFVIDAVAASSASSRSDSSSSLLTGTATSSSTYAASTSSSSVNAARPSRYPYQDNPSNTGVPRQLLIV
jgi:hypothetical protein